MLYLVRDPRATLFSQAKVLGKFNWKKEIKNVSNAHCSLLDDDMMAAERLSQIFPGQVKGIRYEEGALNPFFYTKDIYNFLGLPYSQGLANYIEELTNASRNESGVLGPYSIIRHNASITMNKWRLQAGYENVREIDAVCGHLYSKLGYKFVHSQQDLESTRSLVGKPEPSEIFY